VAFSVHAEGNLAKICPHRRGEQSTPGLG
jgi:hypothetical protein